MPRPSTTTLVAVVILCGIAFGQNHAVSDSQSQQSAPFQRDPTAVATISRAVTAMGFATTADRMTVRLTGSVAPAPHSEDPAGTFTSIVELTNSGYQVRNEFEYASDGKRTVFVAGKNGAAFSFGQRVIKMSAHLAMVTGPSQMPVFELIHVLTKPHYRVKQAAPRQVGGVSAVHITIRDDTDEVSKAVTPQDWYFDPTSGLPLRWEFQEPDTFNALARSVTTGAKEFSNYQRVNGMLLPMQATYFRGSQAASVTTLSSAELNLQIQDSVFDLPKGGN